MLRELNKWLFGTSDTMSYQAKLEKYCEQKKFKYLYKNYKNMITLSILKFFERIGSIPARI